MLLLFLLFLLFLRSLLHFYNTEEERRNEESGRELRKQKKKKERKQFLRLSPQTDTSIDRYWSIWNPVKSNGVLLHCDQFHPPAWRTAEEHQGGVQRTNRNQRPEKHGKASHLLLGFVFSPAVRWGKKAKFKCFYFEKFKRVGCCDCFRKVRSLNWRLCFALNLPTFNWH